MGIGMRQLPYVTVKVNGMERIAKRSTVPISTRKMASQIAALMACVLRATAFVQQVGARHLAKPEQMSV